MSKGLDVLNEIVNEACGNTALLDDNQIIERASIIEKELKAFELIKTKEVEPTMIYNNYKNYEGYLAEMEKYYVSHNLQRDREDWNKNYVLTKEEFDFLNDVLFENEEEEL